MASEKFGTCRTAGGMLRIKDCARLPARQELPLGTPSQKSNYPSFFRGPHETRCRCCCCFSIAFTFARRLRPGIRAADTNHYLGARDRSAAGATTGADHRFYRFSRRRYDAALGCGNSAGRATRSVKRKVRGPFAGQPERADPGRAIGVDAVAGTGKRPFQPGHAGPEEISGGSRLN